MAKMAKKIEFLFDKVKNTVGKGENAGLHIFFPFLQCLYIKASFTRTFKTGRLYGKGLNCYKAPSDNQIRRERSLSCST